MQEHKITSREELIVEKGLNYNEETSSLEPVERLHESSTDGYKEYFCTCGKSFDYIENAEEHIQQALQ